MKTLMMASFRAVLLQDSYSVTFIDNVPFDLTVKLIQ